MADLVGTLRSILTYQDKIDRLSEDVAALADEVEQGFTDLDDEVRQLDRRLSRLEGGIAVLRQLDRDG